MLTWTTYGSWLQGDRRGYVKDGDVLGANDELYRANQRKMESAAVTLGREQQLIVRETILATAEKAGQKVFAVAVGANHLHVLVEPAGESFGRVVSRYKEAARKAVAAGGFAGKLWTRGFDKRYCNNREELISRARYIGRHEGSVVFVE